jgi:chaperonin cofactor prefoldin
MKRISLFDIGTEFYALNELVNEIDFDNETGEVIDNDSLLIEMFESVKGELAYKLDNSKRILQEMDGDVEILDQEIKRLTKKKKALQNRSARLKDLMMIAIKASGEDKIKTLLYSFSVRKTKSVNITNEEEIERKYMRIKHEVDKKKITEALKAGESVNGAEFIEKESLNVK